MYVLDTVAINQPAILLSKELDEPPLASFHPSEKRIGLDFNINNTERASANLNVVMSKTLRVTMVNTESSQPEIEKHILATFYSMV